MTHLLNTSTPGASLKWLLPLLVLTVGYRVATSSVDFLGNTAPLMAITFGGAMLLGPRFWWLPVALLLTSDLALGLFHGGGSGIGSYTLMSAVFYIVVALLGGKAGRREKIWPMMWCGTLLFGLLFYVVANTYSWLVWPGYAMTPAGWWQAQTTGVPGINPPAWMFLRNALIADSIWCGLAGLLYFAQRRSQGAAVVVAASR
ncbi:MAG: hypothetical protein GXX91_04790 [Verrucomicrobiaceae bacterium]|nr:hypothetical protein [Verrucomicrobiaceae bacterium]